MHLSYFYKIQCHCIKIGLVLKYYKSLENHLEENNENKKRCCAWSWGLGNVFLLNTFQTVWKIPGVIADKERISRYQQEGVYINGEQCEFRYLSPEEAVEKAELILICTKFHHLEQAIEEAKPFCGGKTH